MYIYKITNTQTGNFYYGQRSAYTGKPEDDSQYWGSSKLVKKLRSQDPHNWVKEIVSMHPSMVELADAENTIIREHWGHPLLLNRGIPGAHVYRGGPHSEKTKKKMSIAKSKPRKPLTQEHKDNLSAAQTGRSCPWNQNPTAKVLEVRAHRSAESIRKKLLAQDEKRFGLPKGRRLKQILNFLDRHSK